MERDILLLIGTTIVVLLFFAAHHKMLYLLAEEIWDALVLGMAWSLERIQAGLFWPLRLMLNHYRRLRTRRTER